MQATTTGANRTGAASAPDRAKAMADAVRLYNPPGEIDTTASARERGDYVADADAIGSIPPPASLKGAVKTTVDKLLGDQPGLLLDKIGERVAFERAGTRLYDAMIAKYRAALDEGGDLPSIAEALAANGEDPAILGELADETPMETLERIRAEELSHFHMLCEAVEAMGGDPTAQTPSADVIATASIGLVQVMTDPRTTLAQSLNALLTAELTDNAGWELLAELAAQSGEDEFSASCLDALAQEEQHLLVVRNWLAALLANGHPSVSV